MFNLTPADEWRIFALIAIAVAAYAGIGWTVTRAAMRLCRTDATRGVVATAGALLFALAPIWDVLPARLAYDRECGREAQVRIDRIVEGVDGFALAAPIFEGMLQGSPYRWLEGRGRDEGWVRLARAAGGGVSSAAIPQTTARYIVEYSVTELPFSVTVRRTALVDRVTGEVLGTRGSVEGRGGWLRRVVGGPSDQCHGDWEAHLRFVYDTLRPVGHHAGPPIPPSLD